MKRHLTTHFGLRLTQVERDALTRLAEEEGLSRAATLRRLIRQAAAAPSPELRSNLYAVTHANASPSSIPGS